MGKTKGLIAEFKEFINRGNAMDMAVGVIIGGAFTAIVNSLIDGIINPVISIVTGGGEVGQGLSIQIGSAVINFGSLIGAIINFLLIALVVFVMVKSMNTHEGKDRIPDEGQGSRGRTRSRAGAQRGNPPSPRNPRLPRGQEPVNVRSSEIHSSERRLLLA